MMDDGPMEISQHCTDDQFQVPWCNSCEVDLLSCKLAPNHLYGSSRGLVLEVVDDALEKIRCHSHHGLEWIVHLAAPVLAELPPAATLARYGDREARSVVPTVATARKIVTFLDERSGAVLALGGELNLATRCAPTMDCEILRCDQPLRSRRSARAKVHPYSRRGFVEGRDVLKPWLRALAFGEGTVGIREESSERQEEGRISCGHVRHRFLAHQLHKNCVAALGVHPHTTKPESFAVTAMQLSVAARDVRCPPSQTKVCTRSKLPTRHTATVPSTQPLTM